MPQTAPRHTVPALEVHLLFAHEPYYPAATQEINATVVTAASLLHLLQLVRDCGCDARSGWGCRRSPAAWCASARTPRSASPTAHSGQPTIFAQRTGNQATLTWSEAPGGGSRSLPTPGRGPTGA